MDTFEHDNKIENDIKSVNVWDWKIQIFNLNSVVFNKIKSLQDAEPNTASQNSFTYTCNWLNITVEYNSARTYTYKDLIPIAKQFTTC